MRLAEWNAYARLPLDIASADGCELVLKDGRRLLDLYGGHCVSSLGAGEGGLGATIASQWNELSFVTNLLDHAPRHDFLAAFETNLPAGDWRVFASNSGAEANENALKVALAATGRSKVVCFRGAFHGRTAAAAAVSDVKHRPFPAAPFEVMRSAWGDASGIDAATGAVILEPIQSLAGVVDPPRGFLAELRERCTAAGAALIFDEVQTGNGRLGTPWAAQRFGVVPDFFTTAKGAAGGLPIGLTVALAEWERRMPAGLLGSTFGGGPLVLAAAAEVARRIASPGFLAHVDAAGRALATAARRGPVARVTGCGLLLGLVLEEGLTAKAARDAMIAQGVLVGTCDDPQVLRLCPPLTVPLDAAAKLERAIAALPAPVASGRA